MCREHTGLIAFASLFGLLQSVLWVAASAVLILIYYCIVPIAEYEDRSDFFRVTLVKLYFEGPKCIPDGSYLGKFNEDYRNSITLIGREVLMFGLIAYVILCAIYFFLSALLYFKRRRPKKRLFTTGWGVITLILCALDFLITYSLLIDSLTLMEYFSDTSDLHDVQLGAIPFIPMLLSFISSRFVVIWVWNFFIGFYIFFIGLCGSSSPKASAREINLKMADKPPQSTVQTVAEKVEEKPKVGQHGLQRPREERDGSLHLVNDLYRTGFTSDVIKAYPEYRHTSHNHRRSMEAVTKFSEEDIPSREYHPHNWCYEPSSEEPRYRKSHPQTRVRGETNEGYVDDEEFNETDERSVDFQHNLRNFESGQKKIKILRPHPEKPVGIPVPPPLPPIGSCNC